MKTFTSEPLELPAIDDANEVSRADLVFYGVDHSGPSFEARVFLNNATADADTERTLENGYAGSFSVFGHNGCFGDDGHCLPDQRHTDEFDLRAPHPLRPLTMTVIASDAIRRALIDSDISEIVVTVVAVVPEDGFPKSSQDPLRFDYVRLLTYEG
jgi:hypothetical protein